jgi:hypothetical protein
MAFSQKFLDESFAAFMATSPPPGTINVTAPVEVRGLVLFFFPVSLFFCPSRPPTTPVRPRSLPFQSLSSNPPVSSLSSFPFKNTHAQVDIGCNYNTAPAPLGWQMWCAGPAPGWPAANKASVLQSQAPDGTFRRKITLDPQPGLTEEALQWYTSGLSSPVVDWAGRVSWFWVVFFFWIFHHHSSPFPHTRGPRSHLTSLLLPPLTKHKTLKKSTQQKWYWYELWHPIDHVESKNRLATPSKADALRPRTQTLIHERYAHAPASYTGPYTYETDAWFTVLGTGPNWAARRQEIALFTQGFQAWTLILSLEETAEGGVVTAELILGVPATGSDPVNPAMGLPLVEAQAINKAAFIPYFLDLQNSNGAGPGFDAMSRHVVEEFSNLGRFVPALYKSFKANPAGAMPTLGGRVDLMGAMFNVTEKTPKLFLKNDTLLTLGLPLSVPGPKRSPVQLPFLANESDTLTEKVEALKAAVNDKVMALGVGKAGHGGNHTH